MISDHDLSTKINQIKKNISQKNSITLIMPLKGRFIQQKDLFQIKFNKILSDLETTHKIILKKTSFKNNVFSAKF